jgi:hypothetical protein
VIRGPVALSSAEVGEISGTAADVKRDVTRRKGRSSVTARSRSPVAGRRSPVVVVVVVVVVVAVAVAVAVAVVVVVARSRSQPQESCARVPQWSTSVRTPCMLQ